MARRLLCTDLDRTVIPNGEPPESPPAKELFERVAGHRELTLVYVTGRHRQLIEQAILNYDLPQPAFAIGDVGTTIYEVVPGDWQLWNDWQEYLSEAWPSEQAEQLRCQLTELTELTLQEIAKQNRFKISYYARIDGRTTQLLETVQSYVTRCQLDANLVWSVDSESGLGLLDILPKPANKLTAIQHLIQQLGVQEADTIFAGDSGNDIDVFRSNIPSIVVANADPAIIKWAQQSGKPDLYVARGCLPNLNGNYRAGIIEGVCHFWPEVRQWLEDP